MREPSVRSRILLAALVAGLVTGCGGAGGPGSSPDRSGAGPSPTGVPPAVTDSPAPQVTASPTAGPTAPPSAPPSIDPGAWELAWSDEFDGPAGSPPDPATWGYDLGDGSAAGLQGWGNQERQWYTDDPRNAATDGDGQPADHRPARRRVPGLLVRPVRAHVRADHDEEPLRGRVRPSRGAHQGPRRLRSLAGLLAPRHEHRHRAVAGLRRDRRDGVRGQAAERVHGDDPRSGLLGQQQLRRHRRSRQAGR